MLPGDLQSSRYICGNGLIVEVPAVAAIRSVNHARHHLRERRCHGRAATQRCLDNYGRGATLSDIGPFDCSDVEQVAYLRNPAPCSQ